MDPLKIINIMKSTSTVSMGTTNTAMGGNHNNLTSSSAQLASTSQTNMDNHENLLFTNKPTRPNKLMRIPDFSTLRNELMYSREELVVLPAQTSRLGAAASTINNPIGQNNTSLSNDMTKSHVRFDKGNDDSAAAAAAAVIAAIENEDAATWSSYSSDETTDLMSEARGYADIDDERADIMRMFLAEARYHRDGPEFAAFFYDAELASRTPSAVSVKEPQPPPHPFSGDDRLRVQGRKLSTAFNEFDSFGAPKLEEGFRAYKNCCCSSSHSILYNFSDSN